MIKAECHDCKLDYTDEGFQDLIIPDEDWKKISPANDQYGLLCPNCIIRRLSNLNIRTTHKFRSGPFTEYVS